jgi:hypothetical protein
VTRLRLNPEVRVSDLITAASVAVAAVVFVASQLRGRAAQDREYAGRVRAAALGELGSLQRVRARVDAAFDDAGVLADEGDEVLDTTRSPDVAGARVVHDVDSIRGAVESAVAPRGDEGAWVSLYGYQPCAESTYETAADRLYEDMRRALRQLEDSAAAAARDSAAPRGPTFARDALRRRLRAVIAVGRAHFDSAAGADVGPLERSLTTLARASDEEIVARRVPGYGRDACGR